MTPKGHAYLLHGSSTRKLVDDGLLLTGDAAGLAYAMSGEGIRPAIESGLLAAKTILAAGDRFSRENLEPYCSMLAQRFSASSWATAMGRHLPPKLVTSIGRRALGWRWFARDVVLKRWFLHAGEPALLI
jgi:flavin-dependent dehydrogenase